MDGGTAVSDLTEYENFRLIEATGKTRFQIRDMGGPSERAQVYLTNDAKRETQGFRGWLLGTAMELQPFPWTSLVGRRIARIKELRDDRNIRRLREEFELLVEFVERHLAERPNPESDPAGDLDDDCGFLGARYLLGQYWLSIALHGGASDPPRPLARKKAIEHFAAFEVRLRRAMDVQEPRISRDTAEVLAFKAVGNIVVLEWNATLPKMSRGTCPRLMALLRETRYFERAARYSELMPKVLDVPFNALAIASALDRQDSFEVLHQRLRDADEKYDDLEALDDPDFDEDFANFLAWWRGSRASMAKKALESGTGMRNATAGARTCNGETTMGRTKKRMLTLAARLVVCALMMCSATVGVTAISAALSSPVLAELKPHT
jgi:hypothetical protein